MREQFTFYRSYFDAIESIKKANDKLAIYKAIASYALYEEEPDLSDVPAAIFALIRPTLDASKRKAESGRAGGRPQANGKQTESKREANGEQMESKPKANRKQTGSKPKANGKQTASEKESEKENENEIEIENECYSARTRFASPSVEEVAAYCAERGNGIDAQQFVDFYASKGWKVGSTPMKDWKAAVRTWEKRERPHGKEWSFDDF